MLRLGERRQLGVRRPGRADGQLERARPGEERQRHRLGRGPGPRPVRGRDGDAEAVSGRKRVRDRVELDPHAVAAARLEQLRVLVRVAVGEVEQAARDERRSAVGRDVAEADADERAAAGRRRARARPRAGRGSRRPPRAVRSRRQAESASSGRWSPARSAGWPSAHQTPASAPSVCTGACTSVRSPVSSGSARQLEPRRRPRLLGGPAAGPDVVARLRRTESST